MSSLTTAGCARKARSGPVRDDAPPVAGRGTSRVALLEKLDFGYRQMAQIGQMWPIVDTRVRYIRSVPFGSTINATAQLVEWEFRLRIYYELTDARGQRVNEAYTVQVPVTVPDESLIIGVPDLLREKVAALINAQ